jgi:type II secretory pathway pseudopilin PulG
VSNQRPPMSETKLVALGLAGLVALVLIIMVMVAGFRAFGRWQKRADAHNQVAVTHILIKKAQQQALINRAQIAATIAEAQKRYQEAVGIRRAQDEIQKTLTPLYVQHEAIRAQERVAESGKNNTIIYSPSGSNGVPLVQTPPTNTGRDQQAPQKGG